MLSLEVPDAHVRRHFQLRELAVNLASAVFFCCCWSLNRKGSCVASVAFWNCIGQLTFCWYLWKACIWCSCGVEVCLLWIITYGYCSWRSQSFVFHQFYNVNWKFLHWGMHCVVTWLYIWLLLTRCWWSYLYPSSRGLHSHPCAHRISRWDVRTSVLKYLSSLLLINLSLVLQNTGTIVTQDWCRYGLWCDLQASVDGLVIYKALCYNSIACYYTTHTLLLYVLWCTSYMCNQSSFLFVLLQFFI